MQRWLAIISVLAVVLVACGGGGGAAQPAQSSAPAAQPAASGGQPAKPAAPSSGQAAQPAAPSGQAAQLAGARQKIVIATGIDAAFTHLVVAAKKGFLEKHNVEAEYKPFDDGNVALDAILTGNADVSATSEFGGIVRRAKGGKIYIVGYAAKSGQQLGISGKSSISQPKDFEGKTVGFPQASGGHYFFSRYVKKHNLDASKITVKNLQAPETIAALNRGDVDAIFLWEPWISRAAREVPNTKVIARSGDDDVFTLMQYTYFSQRLIDDKELGARVLKGIIDASAWIQANPDEAAKVISEAYKLTPEDSKVFIQRFKFESWFTPEIRQNVQEAAQLLKDQKIIQDIPNLDEYLHPEIMQLAAPSQVKS